MEGQGNIRWQHLVLSVWRSIFCVMILLCGCRTIDLRLGLVYGLECLEEIVGTQYLQLALDTSSSMIGDGKIVYVEVLRGRTRILSGVGISLLVVLLALSLSDVAEISNYVQLLRVLFQTGIQSLVEIERMLIVFLLLH